MPPPPFDKTYSLRWLTMVVGLPLGIFLMLVTVYVLLGCFEPTMEIDCERTELSVDGKKTCTIVERTWLNQRGPTTIDLDATSFEMERSGKQRYLRIKNTKDGSVAFPTRLTNNPGHEIHLKVAFFGADPNQKTLSARAGNSPNIVFYLAPIMLIIISLPIWMYGGELFVRARPGFVSVTRARWLLSHQEKVLMFPEYETPQFSLARYGKTKALIVRASTGDTTTLADTASPTALTQVKTELEAYFSGIKPR